MECTAQESCPQQRLAEHLTRLGKQNFRRKVGATYLVGKKEKRDRAVILRIFQQDFHHNPIGFQRGGSGR